MNRRAVGEALGLLLLLCAAALLAPLTVACGWPGGDPWRERLGLGGAAAIAAVAGGALRHACRGADDDIGAREGFAVVTFGWLACSAVGAIPFVVAGGCSVTDAWFETVSGFTTTGASILPDPTRLAPALLLWRALTQWIGGLGIVVLLVAVLPGIGAQGGALVRGESAVGAQRLRPRIADTARLLWSLYAGLTVVETLLLMAGGMSVLDAACHAMSTLATGGFSTRILSVADFRSPYLEWVITAFMWIGGVNFVLIYTATVRGRPRRLLRDPEFRVYAAVALCATAACTVMLGLAGHPGSPWRHLRLAAFQVASCGTSTGFATDDFALWPSFGQGLLLVLMVLGGCVGSTSGALKVSRVVVAAKVAWREARLMLSPRAVIPLRLGDEPVEREAVQAVLGFMLWYGAALVIGTLVVAATGLTLVGACSGVVACLGNAGPGLAEVGPMANFSACHPIAKWTLSGLMLLGRLEIYCVILLFVPATWRR